MISKFMKFKNFSLTFDAVSWWCIRHTWPCLVFSVWYIKVAAVFFGRNRNLNIEFLDSTVYVRYRFLFLLRVVRKYSEWSISTCEFSRDLLVMMYITLAYAMYGRFRISYCLLRTRIRFQKTTEPGSIRRQFLPISQRRDLWKHNARNLL